MTEASYLHNEMDRIRDRVRELERIVATDQHDMHARAEMVSLGRRRKRLRSKLHALEQRQAWNSHR